MQGGTAFDHSLGGDDEFHVADDGDATPCHWCRPEGGVVGDTAGDCGKVGVRGRKEVEFDLRGEDFWRERRGEEGREARLEEAESWN